MRRLYVSVVAFILLMVSGCASSSNSQSSTSQSSSNSQSSTSESPAIDQSTTEVAGSQDSASQGSDVKLAEDIFSQPIQVVVANTAGTVTTQGEQRIMTALIGEGPNNFVGGASEPIEVSFQLVDGGIEPVIVQAEWLTTNAAALGLYVSKVQFERAGVWQLSASHQGAELGSTLYQVVESSPVPQPGDPAPASDTLTATDTSEPSSISTDLNFDPSLYRLSIADAVGNGSPTLIAFSTPGFCLTLLCGPTLDFVKGAAAGRDGLDVVHVEPFDLELAPTGLLEPIPAMTEWGLATEPWVFVVDSDGNVTHSFEGIVGQAEIEKALDQL